MVSVSPDADESMGAPLAPMVTVPLRVLAPL